MREAETKRLTNEQLLLIAIALVKASDQDGPNFVYEVAAVFHALRQNEDSRTQKHPPSNL